MAWFRRRSTSSTADSVGPTPVAAQPGPRGDRHCVDLVPMVSGQSLERTERALKMLATQSAQLHGQVVHLERRVDALSDALLDRLDVPSHGDLLEARIRSEERRVGKDWDRTGKSRRSPVH